MNSMDIEVPLEVLLERQLMHRYGPLIGNDDLSQALGYPSKDAFRQALSRKSVPVPVFEIENRRGKFALIGDVAKWLVTQRGRSVNAKAVEPELSSATKSNEEDAP